MKLTSVCVTLLLATVIQIDAAGYRKVCYYTNWTQYRNGVGKFFPENIDTSLCTHIVYAFAFLNGNHLHAVEWNDLSTQWMKGMYVRFNDLKKINPALKTFLAVGGFTMGTMKFSQMVSTDANIMDFANDAIEFLRTNDFDGLDLDWEYPAFGGGPARDKYRLTKLVKTLKSEFEKEAHTSGKDRLLLSAALPAGKDKIDAGFEVPEFSKYLDMANLMAYDYHGGSWEDHTGHNSPLYKSNQDTGLNAFLNVQWTADYWVSKGMPPSLINLGLAFYGRTFTLRDSNNNGLYAPDVGNGGHEGAYSRSPGFLAYYEICTMLKNGATRHYLNDQKVPYLVQGDQWVGYEDVDSLRIKVDFAKQKGYGGIMVWSFDNDDFTGMCGQGKYPLLTAINQELSSSSVIQQTTPAPLTVIPQSSSPTNNQGYVTSNNPATSTSPNGPIYQTSSSFSCLGKPNGFYPNPNSCSSYYICAALKSFIVHCAPNLYFNPKTNYCDYPYEVQCQGTQTTKATTQTTITSSVLPQTLRPIATVPVTTIPPFSTNTPVLNKVVEANLFCRNKPNGLYRDPNNCGLFFQCDSGLGFSEPCAPGLAFNEAVSACDYPYETPGCQGYIYYGKTIGDNP